MITIQPLSRLPVMMRLYFFLPFFSACLALPCPALPAHFFSQVEEEGLGSSGTSNYNLYYFHAIVYP